MRVISIGDLVTDYYYMNGEIVGVSGGMTSHNIVANLAKSKIKTIVYGVCGNDAAGNIAIQSLKDLNVDVSKIKVMDNIYTRAFHVSFSDNSFVSKKRCPICNNKKWYDESMIDSQEILNAVLPDDILVFDNLNNKNQTIIDNSSNIKIIDLGQYFEFEKMTNEEIISRLKNKFEIISFNERVVNYLKEKINISDISLFKLFNPRLMIITKGDKGACFIYNNKIYDYKLENKGLVVDPTGAGDAFLSSIIKDYIKSNYIIDANKFETWFNNATKITSKVVTCLGARSHLKPLYKIRKVDDKCLCDTFSYVKRKQIKRCNININNLPVRIKNDISDIIISKLNNIGFNNNEDYLFIGTGGSYAAAYFASNIINQLYKTNTYALYPRDVLYRNNDKIKKVILFSYSGTTNDIMKSIKSFDKKNIYVITKGNIKNIVMKTGLLKENIITYKSPSNKGMERGFLSFEGVLAPATIFLKYYYKNIDKSFKIDKFIFDSMMYWDNYFSSHFDKYAYFFKKGNMINLFRGDYSNAACYDLESKLIESGILNTIIHEKKNFSHGRFVNYESLNNYSIYFKCHETTEYEQALLNYLSEHTMIVESKYDGILASFDLLVASQYIIYYIGKTLNIDVSKPSYSDAAMKIYFYKNNL